MTERAGQSALSVISVVSDFQGSYTLLVVADYFENERGHKLYAYEWSRVLKITMGDDLIRDSGTRRVDLMRALHVVGLRYRNIRGRGDDGYREAFRKALRENRPVIVGCMIPYEDEPARHYTVLVKMEYFAAVQSGVERDYRPMERIFTSARDLSARGVVSSFY